MNPVIARSRLALVPGLSRDGITWRTVDPGCIEICVELVNDADRPTEPDELVIETAALGAFVPFRPVTRVALGALEPGERRQVRTPVARALLPGQRPFSPEMAGWVQQTFGVEPKFADLMSRSTWAGNVNVYFDRRPDRAVEVHRALDPHVPAGTPVVYMVDLPPSRTDYRVEVRTSDPDWTAGITPLNHAYHFLVVKPPAVAGLRGRVTVDATRLQDHRTVPVEFTLETVAR